MRVLVRRLGNPVVLALRLAGDRRSPWGVLTVPGRISGQPRSNPVLPHRAGSRVVIPLSYGEDVQWVKNVLSAGRANLRYRDEDMALVRPRTVDLDEVAGLLPPAWQISTAACGSIGS
jgi:deazaflavin-dependent oxidoreductase (nitroreductase family)